MVRPQLLIHSNSEDIVGPWMPYTCQGGQIDRDAVCILQSVRQSIESMVKPGQEGNRLEA